MKTIKVLHRAAATVLVKLEKPIEQQRRDWQQHNQDLERHLKGLENNKDALREVLRSEYDTKITALEARNRELEIAVATFEGAHTSRVNFVERTAHRREEIWQGD